MGKPTDHEMSVHLQRLLKEWLAEDPRRTEVDFAKAAGLSKATINNVKNKGGGAGHKTVAGFAKALGQTTTQLHAAAAGASQPLGPSFRDLPGWQEIKDRLRATPRGRSYSEAAWRAAGSTASDAMPAELDEFTVLQLVDFWHHALPSAPPASEERSRKAS